MIDRFIVGLGNPGKEYELTRHNIGKIIVDGLKNELSDIQIIETTHYMNELGGDIANGLHYYKGNSNDLWVIHDDLDLPFGTVRINFNRSSAGHRGVQSIIDTLKTQEFWRVRVGIGRSETIPSDAYVLEKFTGTEQEKIPALIDAVLQYMVQSTSGKPEEKTIVVGA